jgi:hypothetical protein
MDWTTRVLGFDSRRGLGIILFTTASRTALGPTQPPIHWVPGALSPGVKHPGHEADHSPPSSSEVKNAWSYISTPPIRLHGVMFNQAQEQLYFCIHIFYQDILFLEIKHLMLFYDAYITEHI